MKKLGLLQSFAIYVPAAVSLWLATDYLIPFLSQLTGHETILSWFFVAGSCVFAPMIVTSVLIVRSEGYRFQKNTWTERLRFHRPVFHDLKWAIAGLILAGLLSGGIMKLIGHLSGTFDHTPAFMSFTPLDHGRYWILAA